MAEDRAKALDNLLRLPWTSARDYNSRQARWDGTRNKIANKFDEHDYSMQVELR